MVWTDKHNETFVAEMYLHEPWKYKKGSKERGNVWDMISESLNNNDHPKFAVCLKSVRDQYNHLEKEQKRKIREEEKASGIAPEHSAFDDSMEDIIERFKARDEEDQRQVAANKEKADADAAVAADMRKASMETFSQTKKRKGEQDVKKRKRATGSDTVAFLREKAELDAELKREELKIREQEMKDKKAEQDNLHAQQQAMSAMLHESMQQQQQQQAQLMQQIQLQNAALISLLSKQK